MPGHSVEDFIPGQYVAMRDDYIYESKIVRVVSFDDLPLKKQTDWKFYETEKRYVWIESPEGKFNGHAPGNLLTADEMEETLYHCSYCGLEGHNRRTCPKLEASGEYMSGDKMVFSKNEKVSVMSLNKGDLFMVSDTRGANVFNYGLYEVTERNDATIRGRVIESGGQPGIGSFGKNWAFETAGRWEFYTVNSSKDGVAKIKTLPIWELIEVVLPASRLTLLYGPPGTGKTTAGNFCGNPEEVYNLTLTEETPAAELRGHFIPKGNEFVWMDGPALTAFKKGARLVLNEIDKASGDALTFCHALLDDPGIAKITLPYKDEHGESVSVKPHPSFNVVATMNGEPEDLPEALRDRFAVRINVDKVHPNAIKSLPLDLQKIASKGVSKDGERSVSIRGWNAFVQLREIIGEENAARAVFGSRADTILNTIKIDGLSTSKK